MTYSPSSYWSLTNRDRRELASWQLAAAVAQVLPVHALFELHEGDATYDTLQLSLNGGDQLIKINRAAGWKGAALGSPVLDVPEFEAGQI